MQSMIKCVRELEEEGLKKRMPQEEHARRLDIAFSTINRRINGKTKPSVTRSKNFNTK